MITRTRSITRKGWFNVYCDECQEGINGSSSKTATWAKEHNCKRGINQ